MKKRNKDWEKDFGEKVLEIVNKWEECTSEGGIYWETCYWGDSEGKDPEKEIVKEVNKLLKDYLKLSKRGNESNTDRTKKLQ